MAPDAGSAEDTATARARRAVVMAGHTGDAAVAREALSHPVGSVRSSAVTALERLGELELDELNHAMADDSAHVRLSAAKVAARPAWSDCNLADLLDDPDLLVAEQAAFSLGEHPVDEQVPSPTVALLAEMATGHAESLCREAAVAALGSLGHPDGLDAVLKGCTDRAPVRRRAVLALAAFEDARASEMLRALAADRDLQVRQAAEDLIAIEDGEDLGTP